MATTAGQTDRSYLSSVNFLDQREIYNKLVDAKEEDTTVIEIMDMFGLAKPIGQEEYHDFSKDYMFETATVAGSEAQPSAGAASTITLTAGSVKPVVNEMAMTPGGKQSLVTAVSGNDITLKPIDNTDVAHEALSANDLISFFSNAYAEGTGVNISRKPTQTKRSNTVQTFKTSHKITDRALASRIEFEVEGKPYFFHVQQHDAYRKHTMDIAFAFLLGKKAVSLTDANSNTVTTTRGLNETIISDGISQVSATADTFAVEDLRLLSRKLDKALAPSEYWWWVGGEIDTKIDDVFSARDGLKAGGITYNSFGKGSDSRKAIDLGFDSIRIYGRTYHKKVLPALSHEKVTAASGHTWDEKSFLLPTGTVAHAQDGSEQPRFCLVYMETPDGKGIRYKETHTGAYAPVPTSHDSYWQIAYESTQGARFFGSEQFARLYLA